MSAQHHSEGRKEPAHPRFDEEARDMTRRPLPMGDEYGGFILLNVFDLFLTGYIFRHGGREVNPVGVFFLKNYGLAGFAFSKFFIVGLIILVMEAIYRYRPQTARTLMNAANLIYFGVVLWECVLLLFR